MTIKTNILSVKDPMQALSVLAGILCSNSGAISYDPRKIEGYHGDNVRVAFKLETEADDETGETTQITVSFLLEDEFEQIMADKIKSVLGDF